MNPVNLKKIQTISLVLLLFFFLHIVSVVYHFFRVPIVPKGTSTSVKVYPGHGIYDLASELHQQNIIQHPWIFSAFANIVGAQNQLRFGEYAIEYPMTAWNLLQHVTHGTGFVKHRLTIVEGSTFQQLQTAIAQDKNLSQTLQNQPDSRLTQQLNTSHDNLEGLFYPNTYFYTWRNSDFSLYQTAYGVMQKTLNDAWEHRASNLPYTSAYQALIAASLIERETSVSAEKPLIASVILNRLEKHMRLQIDPTVLYGLHKPYGDTITKKDLQSKTACNTYQMNGLPPTPICMPSISSIDAALHPATTNYLYYVATGDGGHRFSKTYQEHMAQTKQFKLQLKMKNTSTV
ncbi:MAG: hypothetical protein A2624_00320 [Gammaproteobacteria bacterium RIFCSPHIGHO2_01_FULL_42_8]|nr:MAG: hypothetical protein A2624_00320 [Gammaproteobacteria bacterium RIFCSPHIGHO2_01_FULL_42_8]